MNDNSKIANLGFFLNYGDGTSKDEVEMELFKVFFQIKGIVHYDRAIGASFENLEQEQLRDVTAFLFIANAIEAVYTVNEEKGFDPYIIVGPNDINVDLIKEEYAIVITWQLLQDLSISGSIIKPLPGN